MDEKIAQNCLDVDLTYTLSRDIEAHAFKSLGISCIIPVVFSTNENSIDFRL